MNKIIFAIILLLVNHFGYTQDVSKSGSVVGILGHQLPPLSNGSPNWNGSKWIFSSSDSTFGTYQPYSYEVYNRSHWGNLNDFTVFGSAVPTISSTGGIVFTGGSSNNSNFITINNTTSLDENYSIEVTYIATSVSGYGILAGKYGTQTNNPYGYTAGYDLVNNQTHIYMPNYNVTRTTSNSNFVVAANDVCRLTFTQKGIYQIAKFEDLTQGYSSTSTYQAIQAAGEMCIVNYAGTVEVKQIKVTSTTNKKPYIIAIGDSKTEAPSPFQTYYTYLRKLGITESWAAQSVQTSDVLPTINYLTKYIKPTYAVLNIGRNDLANHPTYYGSDSTIWQSNYNSIVNKLDSAGIKVIHLLPIPEPVSNFPNPNGQTILTNFITRTYPSQYINAAIGWTDALYLSADSVHPNEAGSRFIAKDIIASGLTPSSGSNFQNDVINPFLNVPTAIVGNYNVTTNQTNTFLLPQTFNSTITTGNTIPSVAGSLGYPSGILKFYNTSLNRVALQTDVTATNNQMAAYNSSGQITPITLGTNLSITSGVLNAAGGGSGFTNPMTTTGDMIIGGASGVATRLAIGSSNNLLGVSGGNPTWGAASTWGLPTISGANAFTGNNTSSGTLAISNTTASTSSTTGALTVAGGVGIGGMINIKNSTLPFYAIRGSAGSMAFPYESGVLEFNGDTKFGIYSSATSMSGNGASAAFGYTGATNTAGNRVGWETQLIGALTAAGTHFDWNYLERNSSTGAVISAMQNILVGYGNGMIAVNPSLAGTLVTPIATFHVMNSNSASTPAMAVDGNSAGQTGDYFQINSWNGSTRTKLTSINSSGKHIFLVPTTATASVNFPSGSLPTSGQTLGDVSNDGTNLNVYNSSFGGYNPLYSQLKGTATLVSGTVTVSNANIKSTSMVIPIGVGATNGGDLGVTITAGTGFTIASTNPIDARAVNYLIIF